VSGYVGSQGDREAELNYFMGYAKGDIPVVVLGDLNEGEKGAAVGWLEGQGFANALPEFDRPTHSWRWDAGLFDVKRRLDHILYPESLYCYSARVLKRGGSDHYPVIAVVGGKKKI